MRELQKAIGDDLVRVVGDLAFYQEVWGDPLERGVQLDLTLKIRQGFEVISTFL